MTEQETITEDTQGNPEEIVQIDDVDLFAEIMSQWLDRQKNLLVHISNAPTDGSAVFEYNGKSYTLTDDEFSEGFKIACLFASALISETPFVVSSEDDEEEVSVEDSVSTNG